MDNKVLSAKHGWVDKLWKFSFKKNADTILVEEEI